MAFNPFKTLFFAVCFGLVAAALSFFIGNVLAICGLALYEVFRHHHPDYALAYRVIAAPFGALMFFVAFITVWVRDLRAYSRSRH